MRWESAYSTGEEVCGIPELKWSRGRWSQFLTPVSLSSIIRPLFVRKDQWMKHRLMQLEEQEMHIQAQMLELQKERFVA
ncbi:hypothetical protein L1987_55182 [Smallanthus sonchifolius]|uniref:Uncharacterized protein n=2 Tax=Smallanthus sonchifolius TaxID=185202 RepID=A0ACB9E943_9ASTR|nr:hypothetical protein L1987_55178 [Smallanthus sonchifolius]KAI3755385.1 hypothetical protein L1987_55182 [Smallanthus sonchifolius]